MPSEISQLEQSSRPLDQSASDTAAQFCGEVSPPQVPAVIYEQYCYHDVGYKLRSCEHCDALFNELIAALASEEEYQSD